MVHILEKVVDPELWKKATNQGALGSRAFRRMHIDKINQSNEDVRDKLRGIGLNPDVADRTYADKRRRSEIRSRYLDDDDPTSIILVSQASARASDPEKTDADKGRQGDPPSTLGVNPRVSNADNTYLNKRRQNEIRSQCLEDTPSTFNVSQAEASTRVSNICSQVSELWSKASATALGSLTSAQAEASTVRRFRFKPAAGSSQSASSPTTPAGKKMNFDFQEREK